MRQCTKSFASGARWAHSLLRQILALFECFEKHVLKALEFKCLIMDRRTDRFLFLSF